MATTSRKTIPGDAAPRPTTIGEEWPPFLILASLTLLFLAQTPAVPILAQLACIFGGVGGLVATLAICRGFAEQMGRAVTRAPMLLLLLLTGWATFRYFTTPPAYRLLATTDLMRIYGGTLAFVACGYILASMRQLGRLVAGIAVFAIFVAFADFSKFGATASRTDFYVNNTSVLGLHMTTGGFLAMLIPVITAFALIGDTDDKARLVSQLTFFVLAFALILARSRSGWVAGFVAFLVVLALIGYLNLRERWRRGTEPTPRSRRNEHPIARLINSPMLWVVLGLVFLIGAGGLTKVLGDRSKPLENVMSGKFSEGGDTVKPRLNSWRAALLMMRVKPVQGLGLGGYMVEQGRWTHAGDDKLQVLEKGTGHQNRAHNYYLQWAVDSGFLGLFLHGAFIAAWLVAMIRGLPFAPSPERRALAIGAVGAAIAGSIDALASPMYQLPGSYALLLAWMGLGLAALRADPPRHGVSLAFSKGDGSAQIDDEPAIARPTPILDWFGAGAFGAAIIAVCVFAGNSIIAAGVRKPRGTFRVETLPKTWEVRPGTRIAFRTIFIDEKGEVIPTLPGTRWQISATHDVVNAAGAGFLRLDEKQFANSPVYMTSANAGFTLVPPPDSPPTAVTIKATYIDDYGRPYAFNATMAVRPDAPATPPIKLSKDENTTTPQPSP